MIAELDYRKADVAELCLRYQVRRLDVFGSAATGAFRSRDSDLDLLVEFEESNAPGLADRYFGLIEELERIFGRPVDLVVSSAIRNPYFRQSVERTRMPLYAA